MSSNENISVKKGHVYLTALLCDSRRPSLYEQQGDTFIGQVITEIWAFQQKVFGLGDSSDWKAIEDGLKRNTTTLIVFSYKIPVYNSQPV